MNHTALVKLLKYFTSNDIKLFSKFLDSPYFNSNKAAIILYNEIKRFYPEFDSELLSKLKIYTKVFPGERFNDVKLRKLISDLNKLAEKYISVESLSKDDNQLFNVFLNFKIKKSYFDNAQAYLVNWKSILAGTSEKKGEDYYYFRLCYDNIESYINSFNRKGDTSYKASELRSLTNYFALKAMHIYCINYVLDLAYDSSQDNILLNEILALDKNGFFSNEPLIHIYSNIVRLFMSDIENSRDILYRVHTELAEFENSISNDEKVALFWIVSQYLVLTSGKFVLPGYNELKWYYLKKQIELQTEMGEKFTWAAFVSIINNGLVQKEFEWINRFINECTHLLNYENPNVLIGWAKAKVLYTKGEYAKSLKELLLINSNLGYMKYSISSLTVMNYYELGYYNDLSYYLQSFGKYISSTDKLYDIGINKKTGNGFMKAVNLLVKLQYCSKSEEKLAIISKIRKITENRILCRNWVLEKLEAII